MASCTRGSGSLVEGKWYKPTACGPLPRNRDAAASERPVWSCGHLRQSLREPGPSPAGRRLKRGASRLDREQATQTSRLHRDRSDAPQADAAQGCFTDSTTQGAFLPSFPDPRSSTRPPDPANPPSEVTPCPCKDDPGQGLFQKAVTVAERAEGAQDGPQVLPHPVESARWKNRTQNHGPVGKTCLSTVGPPQSQPKA